MINPCIKGYIQNTGGPMGFSVIELKDVVLVSMLQLTFKKVPLV